MDNQNSINSIIWKDFRKKIKFPPSFTDVVHATTVNHSEVGE